MKKSLCKCKLLRNNRSISLVQFFVLNTIVLNECSCTEPAIAKTLNMCAKAFINLCTGGRVFQITTLVALFLNFRYLFQSQLKSQLNRSSVFNNILTFSLLGTCCLFICHSFRFQRKYYIVCSKYLSVNTGIKQKPTYQFTLQIRYLDFI